MGIMKGLFRGTHHKFSIRYLVLVLGGLLTMVAVACLVTTRYLASQEGQAHTQRYLRFKPEDFSLRYARISADGTRIVYQSGRVPYYTDASHMDPDPNQYLPPPGVFRLMTLALPEARTDVAWTYQGTPRDHYTGVNHAAALSGNGRYIAFVEHCKACMTPSHRQTSSIYVYDTQLQTVTLESVDDSGVPLSASCRIPILNEDGSLLCFEGGGRLLQEPEYQGYILLRDRLNKTTQVLATGGLLAASRNGRYILYQSFAPGARTEGPFRLYDRRTEQTARIQFPAPEILALGGVFTRKAAISGDGRYLAMTALVRGEADQVYLLDRTTDHLTLVSADPQGKPGNGASGSHGVLLSEDGRFVVFDSLASNLVAEDSDKARDLYRYDRTTQTLEVVGRDEANQKPHKNVLQYTSFDVTSDGNTLIFTHPQQGLVLRDLGKGVTTRLARNDVAEMIGLRKPLEVFAPTPFR